MEKELFIEVLKNYSQSSENEAISVVTLKREFPYSQVLQALSARLTKDYQLFGQKEALQSAAVYAADRVVLKSVMIGNSIIAPEPAIAVRDFVVPQVTVSDAAPLPDEVIINEVKENVSGTSEVAALNGVHHYANNWTEHTELGTDQNAINGQAKEHATAVSVTDSDTPAADETSDAQIAAAKEPINELAVTDAPLTDDGISVADSIMSDLERLNQLKHEFEVMYAAAKAGQPMPAPSFTTTSQPHIPIDPPIEPEQQEKVERLIEMDNALNDAPEEPKSESIKPSLLRRRFGANEAYIDEIVNRKELEPENLKQREQLQMIDEFIRTQPSITPGKDNNNHGDGDLSSNGEFTDNIVSETLVEILLKQGKKDKAIEVLKKLIWKFPQKKAYFAAQIEDLKK